MNVIKTSLGQISINTEIAAVTRKITVMTEFEIHHTGIEKLREFVAKSFYNIAKDYKLSNEALNSLFDGHPPDDPQVAKAVRSFWGLFNHVAKRYDADKFLPEVDEAAKPEAPLTRKGVGTAVYSQIKPSKTDPVAQMKSDSPLSQANGERLPSRRELARQVVELEATRQGFLKDNETYDQVISKGGKRAKKLRESEEGVYQSMRPREHYGQELIFEERMHKYGGPVFKTIDRFAHLSTKNGLQYIENGVVYTVDDSLTSSFDRFATSPTMGRIVEDASDGSTILAAGRVGIAELDGVEQVTAMAVDEVKLIISGNIDLLERGSLLTKGLSFRDGILEVQLVDQSLLTMSGAEKKNYYKMLRAFSELSQKTAHVDIDGKTGLTYTHPVTGEEYQVRVLPVPSAANQFNSFTTIETLVAPEWSGRESTLFASNVADHALNQIVSDHLRTKFGHEKLFAPDEEPPLSPLQKLVHDLLPEFGNDEEAVQNEVKRMVSDTFAALYERKLKPWQEVLARQFVCHIAGIPIVTHCQSSVDRTGIAVGLAGALQHWLKGTQENKIPQVNGKYAIWDVVNYKDSYLSDGEEIEFHPFRELVLFNWVKGNKCAEYSRMDKGYKLTWPVLSEWAIHPALKDILPKDVMHIPLIRKATSYVKHAMILVLLATVLATLLLGLVLTPFSKKVRSVYQKYIFTKNFAITVPKFAWNVGKTFRQPVFHSVATWEEKVYKFFKMKIPKTRKMIRGFHAIDLHEV